MRSDGRKGRRGAELVGGDVRGAAAVAGGLGPLDVQVEQLHLSEENSRFRSRWRTGEADGKSTHLAARQLGQVGLQLLPDHRVDGHQAEDAGLPHAALRVVVALRSRRC